MPPSSQPAKPGQPDPAMPFEEALGQIEAIIERIESGQAGLEQSLAEYERGVWLISHCRAKLDQAEQKVQDLTKRLESADDEGPGDRAPEDS